VRIVTLVAVLCVIFVTHVHETVFLIREREADLVHVERLEKARIEAELSALRAQVDPHFGGARRRQPRGARRRRPRGDHRAGFAPAAPSSSV
jgi:hypothetical protein